jgi:hypothetical protein
MNIEEWPLKNLNYFAMPVALALAIYADSFWKYLIFAFGIGFVIANVMATLYIAKLRESLKHLNPLSKLSAELQGGNDTSLHIRFIFMQSISGALITGMWHGISSGVVGLFQ